MDWTSYRASEGERFMNRTYLQNGIRCPSDLDMERIAAIFHLVIAYTPGRSCACWDNEFGVIFLNKELSVKEERAVFFHELCHPLHHTGNQWNIPLGFMQHQEAQAAAFQAYAALPCYMLEQYGYTLDASMAGTLSDDFMLPEALILRRLDQIKRRILQDHSDRMQRYRMNGKPYRQPDFFCEESRVLYACKPA